MSCPSDFDQYMVSKRRGRGHASEEVGEARSGGVPSQSKKKGYALPV